VDRSSAEKLLDGWRRVCRNGVVKMKRELRLFCYSCCSLVAGKAVFHYITLWLLLLLIPYYFCGILEYVERFNDYLNVSGNDATLQLHWTMPICLSSFNTEDIL
jgi:hypothetical protein